MSDATGSVGTVHRNFTPCAGGWASTTTYAYTQAKVGYGQTVNVTFPTLPSDVKPPYNISITMADTRGNVLCDYVFGNTTAQNVINTSSFNWTSHTYTVPAGNVTFGTIGESVVFTLFPGSLSLVETPYWVSANYSIVNATTISSASSSTKAPSFKLALATGLLVLSSLVLL